MDEPDSFPETSGTGFIVSALQAAARNGWIEASSGAEALTAFVSPDGTVLNGCPETPPLPSREDYRNRHPKPDDPHAVAAVLMALGGVQP